jgi:hypothetical protein
LFEKKEQKIDPYVVGFFLDGDFSFIKREFIKKYFQITDMNIDDIIDDMEPKVPNVIMTSNIEDRSKFLAGLLDSKGKYNSTTKRFDISLNSEELCSQVMYLSGSIGYYTSRIKNVQSNFFTQSQQNVWNCYVYVNTNCILPSKIFDISYIKTLFGDMFTTDFTIVEDVVDQYYGFNVDGNRRFLLGDFSVVHNSGKTSTLTSLMYEKRHIFPIGMIFSGTEDSNGHWANHFPSTFIYNKLELDRVEDFVRRQKFAKKHLTNPWGLLLLDDCADESKMLNSQLFKSIFKNGRHWKMWFVLSVQYASDIKPVLRSNVDFTFIMRESSIKNRKTIWENYAGVIDDFHTFNILMDEITNDYTALVINNAIQSNKLEDCVFWYKGKKVPDDFKFGSDDYWDYHYARYNQEYKEPIIY